MVRSRRSRRLVAALIVVVLALGFGVAGTPAAQAAVEAPLSLAFDQQVYGDALVSGNSVVVCPAGNTACTAATNRSGTQSSGVNDNFYMTQTGANAANNWFNSSSVQLTIPTGASIAYARLLWAGDTGVFRTGTNSTVTQRCNTSNSPSAVQPPGAAASTPVQLTVGSNPAVSVTAARYTADTITNVTVNQPQFYSAAANVTPSFANAPTGTPLTITTANVWTPAGFGCFGGWSLVLVYSYPAADPVNAPVKREVFVYDGHVRQNSVDPATTTTVSGFRVSGQVNVGVVAYEGDWGITGDQFSVNGTAQTDPVGPGASSTNFFTSYAQNAFPAAGVNNFSVDAKQFPVASTVIKPGDTSASLSFSTSGDTYLAQELVMSVPIPALQITKSASPSTVHAGDTVTYTITVTNPVAGSTATGVVVNDPLTPACNKNIGNLTGSTTYTCTGVAGSSSFTNIANASGTDAQGDAFTGAGRADVTVLAPAISITKTTDQAAYRVGATVTYTITVTNTGNATLTPVNVADASTPGCARSLGSLAAGASTSYTCTATAPVTGNSNTASVTGTDALNRSVTASATASVPVIRPALTLVKSVTPTSVTAAGQSVSYSFKVTNSGDSTINSLSIADTLTAPAGPVPAITCPVTTLAAAATTTCTATYTATQADVDNGSIANSAVANGLDIVGGAVASNASTATVTIAKAPALTIRKTAAPTTVNSAGQTIAYSFVLTNTGNVTVHALALTDTFTAPAGPVPAITCPTTTLAPNASTTCSATYTTTQADIDSGSVTNSATVSGLDPTNTAVVSTPSVASVTAAPGASLALVKSASPTVVTAAGQKVTYSFLVTNTGNLTLNNLAVTDTFTAPAGPVPAVTCPTTTLAPNASTTCTATYTATQADIDNGTIKNSAIANATDTKGRAVASAQSNATVSVTATPKLALTKSVLPKTVTAAGQSVTYTFAVSNTGNVTIKNLSILDSMTSPAGPVPSITCPVTTLAPGAGTNCTATYTATQADIDNGTIKNSAVAQGSDPGGNTVTSPASTAVVTAPANASSTLVKTATPATVTAIGQQISFTFVVTNTGNVTLSSVGITDTLTAPASPAVVVNCPPGSVAPGASVTCTATYTATQADVDNGSVSNTATAQTVTPSGVTQSTPPSTASVPVAVTSALTISKAASPSTISSAGQNVSYTFTVTNSGQTTISGIVVNDPMFTGGKAPTCQTTTLAPGASMVCSASYTSTQADVDRGSVVNTATASGTTPQGSRVTSTPSTATVTATATPRLQLTKSANPSSFAAAGAAITYTFTVVNAGNVTVSTLAISDTLAAPAGPQLAPITCAATSLAPNASTTCTATYATTAADLDNGSISNTATATGKAPSGGTVTSNQSTATVTAVANAALSLVKTVSPTTITRAGQVVTSTFTVTNSGNQTITKVAVTDVNRAPAGALAGAVTCAATTLAAGASTTCSVTYVATQNDVDHGSIADTAVASGNNPAGATITSNSSSGLVTVVQSPALSVVKSGSVSQVRLAGQQVVYSFLVTNQGNVTISGVSIADSFSSPAGPPVTPTCPTTALAPGASLTCTATYTATQADIDNGSIQNSATASATAPDGTPITSPPSTATVTVPQNPSMSLVKAATPTTVTAVGQSVQYTFTIRNTGNVTLGPVGVSDLFSPPAAPALAVNCPSTALAPGAVATCTASHSVTQADLDNGSINNSATAQSTDPQGNPVTSPLSTATVAATQSASLSVAKSASPTSITNAGERVTYAFLVTNTGNVTVTGLAIADTLAPPAAPPLTPINCPVTLLAPAATTTCSATYTATQADVDSGSINNSATATGRDPAGKAVASDPSTASVTVNASPSLKLAKTVTPTIYDTVGQTLTYTFTVTNNGNQTVSGLAIADPMFTGANAAVCAATTLAPAAKTTCSATHAVTQADLDAGTIQNTATAKGLDPTGAAVTSPAATASATANQSPLLTLIKTASPTSVSSAGSVITYSFHVTNTGNVTINNLSINDSFVPPATAASAVVCPSTTLAPGVAIDCTWSYTVTQNDIDSGSINNTATAAGTDPSGNPISSQPSSATVAVPATPALSVVKKASPATITAAGQTVNYTFAVTNTGNVSLSLLSITDSFSAPAGPPITVSCPQRSIAPTAVVTCTATYTSSQADVDNGSITNSAFASAQTPGGATVNSIPSTSTVAVTQNPALTVLKTVSRSSVTAAGQALSYTFTVTNSGNVSVSAIAITDPMFAGPNAPVCAATSLSPGHSTTCTANYTTTQDDIDAGQIRNTATASGTDPLGQPVTSAPSTVTVQAQQNPSLLLVKSALSQSIDTVGQAVTYAFAVTNTGNVTISNLTLADTFVAPAGPAADAVCPVTLLAPGASTTCLATYTSTQADFDAGIITNTATASGLDPQGNPAASNPSTAVVVANDSLSLVLQKTVTPSQITTAGQQVFYRFAVTNTGNVTIHNLVVEDVLAAPAGPAVAVTCLQTSLASLASTTCSATYTASQADADNGLISNTATVTGLDPTNTPVTTNPSTATVVINPAASLTLTKAATPTTVDAAGQTVHYTFTVVNTGNVSVNSLSIGDPVLPRSVTPACVATTLAPGASTTCTADYIVTQTDVDNGRIVNVAVANATTPAGGPVSSDQASATVNVTQTPLLALQKTAGFTAPVSSAGAAINYNFALTNKGNVTLSGLAVIDQFAAPAGPELAVTCPTTPLAPGDTVNCSASYTTSQADIDNGSINNQAFATATAPNDGTVKSLPSSASVPITQTPALTLKKTVSPTTASAAGDRVNYTFLVTNSGQTTITNLTITDTLTAPAAPVPPVSCPVTTLAPTDSTTCTASYVLTQADVDNGSVVNVATANGLSPSGAPVTSPEWSATVTVPENAGLTLTKSATPTTASTAGAKIKYSFLVTNSGNVTLTNLTIDDTFDAPGGPPLSDITCPVTTLAPNGVTTCTGNYTVTQADVDSGRLRNTAHAVAADPATTLVQSSDSVATVTIPQTPSLSLVKSAAPASVSAVGDAISYQFLVTNTGNTTVNNLKINDTLAAPAAPAPDITCPSTTLLPTATTTCTATYAVTQADLDNGAVSNSATAGGLDPTGAPVASNPSSAAVNATQTPAVTLAKTATPSAVSAAGQKVAYQFVVSNVGNVTVTGLTINDKLTSPAGPAVAVTCPTTTLAPTISTTCTATYTATQADVDHGSIDNSAVANVVGPAGQSVASDPSTAHVTAAPTPALTVSKSANPTSVTAAGDRVTYSFLVTNTGNVTLTALSVADTFTAPAGPPPAVTCPPTALAPGLTATCTSTYPVTQADIDNGRIDNSAIASGTDPSGAIVNSAASIATVTAAAAPALKLVKSSPNTQVSKPGDSVTYEFLLTNTGNVTLNDFSIDDVLAAPAGPQITAVCPTSPIAPGGSTTCTADYVVTQADIDHGSISNTATATASDPNGTQTTSSPSTATIPVFTGPPSITLVKSASVEDVNGNGSTDVGDHVLWTFLVTNTGPLTLAVSVQDPTAGAISCPGAALAPTDSITCTADHPHVLTQADFDAGIVRNTATATGILPGGSPVLSDPSTATVPLASRPGLALVKRAQVVDNNGDGVTGPGDTILWTFLVTNTGNVTMSNLVVNDSRAGRVTCPVTSVAPGRSVTCSAAPHEITQAEAAAGDIVNTATVTGTPPRPAEPGAPPVTSPPSTATVGIGAAVAGETTGGGDAGTGGGSVTNPPSLATTGVQGLGPSISLGLLALLLGALLTAAGLLRRRFDNE
ncbi:conserved repeat domain-containing protein [Frankineae bacterium MT45]|nr:conserved repeat domain-containing protein [Frankineae bacterium MT45]